MRQSHRGTALFRAVAGEEGEWDLRTHILAGLFDLTAAANWQRAGDENAKKPDRLPRPGPSTEKPEGEVLARGKAVSIEEMNARLGWGPPAPDPELETGTPARKRDARGRFTK